MTLVSRIGARDLISEALIGLLQRPARSALTALGNVLGIGTFVAVLGLTTTVSGQIDRRFTELAATTVTVDDLGSADTDVNPISFPRDASSKVEALNGVVHAGLWWQVPLQNRSVSAVPETAGDSVGITLMAAEPSTLAAMHPVLSHGRLYNDFHSARSEHVALLGRGMANRLGITRLDGMPAIFIDNIPYLIVGVIDEVARQPEALLSIIIPTTTATTMFGEPANPRAQMIIEVQLGAASTVAKQAAVALRPDAPHTLKATAPPDPRTLRGNVTSDLNTLFLILAAISLTIGAIGIANTTLVAVLERTNEIGLRRAIGARPHHIAIQFLTESATLGLLGGLVGSAAGTAVVVAVALSQGWTPLLTTWTVLPAPLAGGLIGLAAGVYPAWRASRIQPIQALRR